MKLIFSENLKKKIIEELAELEHQQWKEWSKDIAEKEDISAERIKRWKKFWVPYKKLSEEIKEEDRKWAKKIFKIINKYMREK